MPENIIEAMTGLSQEFRLPAGMNMTMRAQLSASQAVPSAPGHEGVSINTSVQDKRRSLQTANETANKNGPPQGPIKGDLYTFSGPQAPEQVKHVPEVGLELHSSPCKYWEVPKT